MPRQRRTVPYSLILCGPTDSSYLDLGGAYAVATVVFKQKVSDCRTFLVAAAAFTYYTFGSLPLRQVDVLAIFSRPRMRDGYDIQNPLNGRRVTPPESFLHDLFPDQWSGSRPIPPLFVVMTSHEGRVCHNERTRSSSQGTLVVIPHEVGVGSSENTSHVKARGQLGVTPHTPHLVRNPRASVYPIPPRYLWCRI